MLWQTLLIFLVIWILKRRWNMRKLVKLSRELKSELPSLPIIGHAYNFIGNDEVQMKAFQQFGLEAVKNNGLTSGWFAHVLFVVIADPIVAEIVLKTFLGKGEITKHVRSVIGNGSIFAPVPIWRRRRKILIPTFSPRNLNQFTHIFSKQSFKMVEHLKPKVNKGPFSIWSYLTTYSMDSVCESTLGVKIGAQKNHNHPFLKMFEKGSKLIVNRLSSPWFYNDIVYMLSPDYYLTKKCKKYICSFVGDIIQSKRKSIEAEKKISENNIETNDNKEASKSFLELLIESTGGDRGYTDVELEEETLVLVMAGTDTSAVGAAFTTLMMARHPDVQEKVFEELNEVFGISKRPVSPEDLPRLKYLDAVIRETLRLYPPGPIIFRHCDRDYTLPSGVTLVEGSTVLVNIWAIHRNPRYWGDDAELFRPERFLDTSCFHPAQFMAFSQGPRNCIGYQYAMMSMKTVLATLLRSYRVLPADTAENPGPIKLKFNIMMKDVDGFTVQLAERQLN